MDWTRTCRTQFWKGATQGPLWPSLVLIGPVVSEEKIFEWKVYDGRTDGRRTQSDGKISPWLQPGELKRVVSSNLSACSYVEIHIPHATKLRRTYCFWPVREFVGKVFVSDSPLKLFHGISWNMVVFKDMTWRYAYRQEILIRLFF